jgi:hypothetical protein
MGQSDAIGAHALTALTVTPPYPERALMLNDSWGTRGPGTALYTAFQTTGITGFAPAVERVGPTPPFPLSVHYGETHVTSMLAQQIFEGSPLTYVGRSDGSPGRPITALMQGSQAYFNALQELTKTTAIVARTGGSVIEPAIAFIDGQSDRESGVDPKSYCANAAILARTWSADARRVTGQAQSVLFFQMQLGAPHAGPAAVARGVGSLISQCQMDLAVTDALFRVAAPSYTLEFAVGGGLHYSAASQRLQGEYLGRAMYQEFQLHKPWAPLYPVSVSFAPKDRSRIEVRFHVPVGRIVRDVTHTPQGEAPADGFTFHDACSDAHVISDTITGPDLIEIRLSAVSKCPSAILDYAYDFIPGRVANIDSSTWGNIRDSDTAKGWAGDTLYNWLVIFSKPVT